MGGAAPEAILWLHGPPFASPQLAIIDVEPEAAKHRPQAPVAAMPVFPKCEFPLLPHQEAFEAINVAVADGQPFSLIRIGDGEAVVLSIEDDPWLQDLAYLRLHWGAEGVTLRAIAEVKRDLESALRGADIVGVREDVLGVGLPGDLLERAGPATRDFVTSHFPLRQEEAERLSTSGARRLAMLQRVLGRFTWSDDQRFCSAWIHWELLASGALATILERVPSVGLVTARPELVEMVARRFGVRTSAVVVPDKFIESGEGERHIPDRYHTIRSELDFPEGSLVLVGAGIPGKVYCQWLKESGCVAIDIGSVFDAWIGKASRPVVMRSRFGVARGDRVPAHLHLETAPPSHTHRLVPRWKPSGSVPS